MAKLFIHTGIHKTGSTSFQIFLDANRELLEEKKIFRIKLLEDKSPTCHSLAHAFMSNNSVEIKKYEKNLRGFLKNFKPKKSDVFVLSSEEFDRFDSASVKILHDVFSPYFDVIKIGLYIRPHAALIDSQYSQQLREGFINVSLDVFFRSCVKHARFVRLDTIISPWVQYFGADNVTVRSALREDLYKNDIAHDIMKHILGIDLPANIVKVPKANKKLSRLARQALLYLLNDQRLNKLSYPQRRKALTEYFRRAPKSDIMLKPFDPVIDYSVLASSKILFSEDLLKVDASYCEGKLDYEKWYLKQINLFDKHQRDNKGKTLHSVKDLSLAQDQFWAFFKKNYSDLL